MSIANKQHQIISIHYFYLVLVEELLCILCDLNKATLFLFFFF